MFIILSKNKYKILNQEMIFHFPLNLGMLHQRVNPFLCVYAKRFCPYSVRFMSDTSPIPARLPSGEKYPKKPLETLWNGLRTA
jgi:hypothetical protein